MANTTSRKHPKHAIPECPLQLYQLLGIVGNLLSDTDDLDTAKAGSEILGWLMREIHPITGIPLDDIAAVAYRIRDGKGLDARPDDFILAYIGMNHAINHVAVPLRELDKDGTTSKLWRVMYQKWPIIREIYEAAVASNGKKAGDAVNKPKGQEQSRLVHHAKQLMEISNGPIASKDLAKLLRSEGRSGATDNAVDSWLRRHRKDHPFCCDDNHGQRRNEARILFHLSDVLPLLREKFKTDEGVTNG